MRALTVVPGQAGSAAPTTLAEPVPDAGELLVDGLALGICATDREIVAGEYGSPAPGRRRLILGHESLGRVRAAAPGTGFAAGDLVVGMVRRPDPHPCGACAHGEFDMCRNGEYTERGIKGRDGYGAERWTVEADYAMKLDPALGRIRQVDGPADQRPSAQTGLRRARPPARPALSPPLRRPHVEVRRRRRHAMAR